MGEEIIIDKDLLRAIGADTRITIMKSLADHQKTQSDLAKELNLSSPTVLEHLEQLINTGLVEKLEEGRKWKYYVLTSKGKTLISSSRKRISINTIIVLGIILIVAIFLFKSPYLFEPSSMDTFEGDSGANAAEKGANDAGEVSDGNILVTAEGLDYGEEGLEAGTLNNYTNSTNQSTQ